MNRDGSTTDDDTTDDERETVTAHLGCVFNDEDERAKHDVESRQDLGDHGVTANGVKLDIQSDCSGLNNKSSLEVWCKGDVCLAPYSGDEEYYEAVIDRIEKLNSIGERNAVVTFIGYESEGSEIVPLGSLRKISRQGKQTQRAVIEKENLPVDESFFTHLKGNETEECMRSKYGEYEVESQRIQADVDSEQNRRKLNVTVHRKKKMNDTRSKKINEASCQQYPGEVKEAVDEESTVTHPVLSRPLNSISTINTKHDISESKGSDMMAGGFDDEDMERPSFSEPAPSPSIPLLLSAPGQIPVFQIPATVNRYLRDYQRDGVRFLYQHYSKNNGAILGDDMGLGKTVQIIAFISAILGKTGTKADIFCRFMERDSKEKQLVEKPEHPKGAFLIVSPGSVMFNWKDELETWGHFKTGLFHANTKGLTLERASKRSLDVVLTTYETLRNHVNDLNRIKWLAVIMDEVHRLKDPKAQITVAAKALRAKRRYGLTGTPLQNRLEEFWCVLDWANPGCLGTAKSFDVKYGKPIKRGQSFEVTKRELAMGRQKSKELQDKLGKWFLRRSKDLLADQLPKKDEMVVFCPLMSFQEDVYQTLLQHPDVELVTKKNFPCDCGSGEDRGKCCHTLSSEKEGIKKTTMRFFQLLLKVANHAALLAPTVKQTLNQQKKARDLCEKVFARYPEFTGITEMSSFELLSDPKYCGKMKVLDKLLRVFQEERCKALLFSRSTQLLNILEEYVISRGLVYRRLDGATKPAERTSLVQEFNRDPGIFLCLVSTKAGGLGLNFTGANVVVIFDPTWNPSNDLQAQDRAYRIGQRRDVRVYRLISSGTIEEMMYLRQVYKQQLANIAVGGTNERRYFTGVEGEKDRKGELFGIENLFSYRAEGASLSKDIVRRTEKLEAGYRVVEYELLPETKEEFDLEKMTRSPGKLSGEDDPYNLEEIASQFVDNDETKQEAVCDSHSLQETQNYEFCDLEGTAGESGSKMLAIRDQQSEEEIKGSQRELFGVKGPEEREAVLSSFDAEESLLSEGDGEVSSNNENATNTELSRASIKPSANKRVSFELFSSSEDEDTGQLIRRKNFTRIKKKRKAIHSENVLVDDRFSEESFNGGRKNRGNREPSMTSSKRVLTGSAKSFSATTSFSRGISKVPRKRKTSNIRFKGKVSTLKRGKAWSGRKKAVGTVTESGKVLKAEGSKKDGDSVQGILESCGVHYTHVNRQIVGPSEAENHMSKQALQDVFELKQFSQQPANCFPALETSDESDDLGVTTVQPEKPEKPENTEQREAGSSHDQSSSANQSSTGEKLFRSESGAPNDVQIEEMGNCTVFIGSTPRAIRRQHFGQMMKTLGFDSEVDLAKCVIESSLPGRRKILKRYYVETNPVLAGLSCFSGREDNCSRKEFDELGERNGDEKGNKSKRKRGKRRFKTSAVKQSEGDHNIISVKRVTDQARDIIAENNSLIKENRCTGNVLAETEEIKSKRRTDEVKSAESSAKKVRGNDEGDDYHNIAVDEKEKIGTSSARYIDDKKTHERLNEKTEREPEEPRTLSPQSNRNIQAGGRQVKPLLSVLDEFFPPDSIGGAKNGNRDGEEYENTKGGVRTDGEEMSEPKINTNSVLDDFI